MNKIIERINKLSLQATILIASIIVGSFYYLSEVNNQKYVGQNIEKQGITAENVSRVIERQFILRQKLTTHNRGLSV